MTTRTKIAVEALVPWDSLSKEMQTHYLTQWAHPSNRPKPENVSGKPGHTFGATIENATWRDTNALAHWFSIPITAKKTYARPIPKRPVRPRLPTPKWFSNLAQDPRIDSIEDERNDDADGGFWIYLKKGYYKGAGQDGCHLIHEYCKKDVLEALSYVEKCECEECLEDAQ